MTSSNSIIFQQDGSPFSTQFDDIYFDTEDGCSQSEDIFINGNDIRQRLLKSDSDFTIAETGFGTGLNFLLTLQLFMSLAQEHDIAELPTLHFISTEKFPLDKATLEQSLLLLPQLSAVVSLLLSQYPEQTSNSCKLKFLDGKVTLSLLIGDAAQSLSGLDRRYENKINAWYLDGFAPAKNPDMWSPALFQQMHRLSAEQATVATFTVAGIVKRGLTTAGFRIYKQVAKGKKKKCSPASFRCPSIRVTCKGR